MPFKIISCSAKRLYDMNMLAKSIFYIHREIERERERERKREIVDQQGSIHIDQEPWRYMYIIYIYMTKVVLQ